MAQLADRKKRKTKKPQSRFRRVTRAVEAADAFTSLGALLLSLFVAARQGLGRRIAVKQDASAGAVAGVRRIY